MLRDYLYTPCASRSSLLPCSGGMAYHDLGAPKWT